MSETNRLAPAPRMTLVERNTTCMGIRNGPQVAAVQSRVLEKTVIEKL